jgi:group I intron endonuclease
MAHIYKTTNTVNGKIYIGKEKHNDNNYIGSGRILNNAVKKYGKEVFVKEILEDCSLDIIDVRECYWIEHYDSTNWDIGYNITKGGTGGDTTSLHPNKEAILQKRSEGIKRWHSDMSEEDRAIWIQSIRDKRKGNFREGKKHSPETIQKIQESNKLATQNRSAEHKRKLLEYNMSRRGKPNLNKRKLIEIDGKIYRGAEEPAKIYGVGCATITSWARGGIKARYV